MCYHGWCILVNDGELMDAVGGCYCVYLIDHSIDKVVTGICMFDMCCVRSIEILMDICNMLKSEAAY